MKKLIFLTVIIMLLLGSCAKDTKTELTNEQKATIENEVKTQWDRLQSSISQLNIETWSEFYSKDAFISAINSRSYISSLRIWTDTVRNSFALRTRHQSNLLDRTVTALTPDLALGTQVAIWENWWKNGLYRKAKGYNTTLWKKGPDGWKIIHVHESREILEEKKGN
jgi:ketosteroid isomerase-like protein